jgi:hypothetical protein
MNDEKLKQLLAQINPSGRDVLRRLMRAKQSERDEFSAALERKRTPSSLDPADLIDMASLRPELRRRLARLLGEIEAS